MGMEVRKMNFSDVPLPVLITSWIAARRMEIEAEKQRQAIEERIISHPDFLPEENHECINNN